MRVHLKAWLAASGLVCFVCVAIVFSYCTVRSHNCEASHFDVLVVLGCPPDPDGRASTEGAERVAEAVREFQAGRADHILLTGGNPYSQSPESLILAPLAVSGGVPKQKLVLETRASNTIDNISYSYQIMLQHGWSRAEIISSPSHLPRTALILSHYPICWRTRASRWPAEYSRRRIARYYVREALGTTALRWLGFRVSTYLVSVVHICWDIDVMKTVAGHRSTV